MIQLPKSIAELSALDPQAELRAGGTDLMERRRSERSKGPVIELRDVAGMNGIESTATGLKVGARVTMAELAASEMVPKVIRKAAGALATPQIRALATVGGNLFQRVRCWYFREPLFSCFQSGGNSCLAREGDHLFHSCFDQGGCIAPHPSTLACALLTMDTQVETIEGTFLSLEEALKSHPRIAAIHLPPEWPSEKSSYFRSISRVRAEWPLVEVSIRLALENGLVSQARLAIGGVSSLPLRREAVEKALIGKAPVPELLTEAAGEGIVGARPLPMTGYKVPLIAATILEGLERALES
jgi:xanthine dehydrogenase YagS FAD-binding subunit